MTAFRVPFLPRPTLGYVPTSYLPSILGPGSVTNLLNEGLAWIGKVLPVLAKLDLSSLWNPGDGWSCGSGNDGGGGGAGGTGGNG